MIEDNPGKKTVRLGLVEDDRLTRSLIAAMINKEPHMELAGQWSSAEDFHVNGMDVEMDLLLVDLELPGERGSDLISKIKSQRPELTCMVLTASSKPDDVFESLRQGASGYLIKDCSPQQLLDGIRLVADEGVSFSPNIARFLVDEFRNISHQQNRRPANLSNLTVRERAILKHLANGRSTKDVATDIGLSYETVRTHLKKIYQKLHVNSRQEAVAVYVMKEAGDASKNL
jgi:DNA-binding NarL/FixJ family response regulator